MSKRITNSSSLEDVVSYTRDLLSEKATLLAEAGLKVQPWLDRELPLFRSLPIQMQLRTVDHLEDRIDLLQAVRKEGFSLLDTRQLLWRTLKRIGWTPQSDVFSYIGDEEIVEIYGLDQRQIFRNLQFFRYVSFTLEQIHSRPWYQLTTRSPGPEVALYQAAQKILSGEVTTTLSLADIPEHLVEEVGSAELRRFRMQMRCISPVLQNGKLNAIIAVNRTQLA